MFFHRLMETALIVSLICLSKCAVERAEVSSAKGCGREDESGQQQRETDENKN